MTKRLKAPAGTDEANFGTEKYRVDNDGTVVVSDEAAGPLLERGGFTLVSDDAASPPSSSFAKVSHPDNASCSYGGVTYEPDENGHLTVPLGAVGELASFGFTLIEIAQEQAPAPAKPKVPAKPKADAAQAEEAAPVEPEEAPATEEVQTDPAATAAEG